MGDDRTTFKKSMEDLVYFNGIDPGELFWISYFTGLSKGMDGRFSFSRMFSEHFIRIDVDSFLMDPHRGLCLVV
jgi:hypothetical protein